MNVIEGNQKMTNDQIKEIALANGFKLKEQPDGSMDLNPYVYEFAQKLALTVEIATIQRMLAASRSKYSEFVRETLDYSFELEQDLEFGIDRE